MTPRVLIGCERSGVMRRAFLALGFDAWSCDTEPADDGSNRHIRDDLRNHLNAGWDLLAVMHPPCTVLCNSGGRWLYIGGKKVNGRDEARWSELDAAAGFYRTCRNAPIERKAIENPVMHEHAIRLTGRGRTQFVQPWWFGEPFFKATGFELIGLPDLRPTNRLVPPAKGTDEHKSWSRVHRMPPGPERARLRSETFPGVAAACAAQWGAVLGMPEQMELFAA
ncbi:hypothetical protein [Novosphingobium sp. MMS21-SN21R]|uniref:hypothetical protein n=1 Tax=Novosphingobium sp. MMS21-SN21R TaxID=2969298 RepID=UPI002883E1E9|nr:hypothetical protein [Novosphingobium sp. MMS21-SN21R]MDT0507497.1 hypothetical protein [Novosphingobium sp. MMS21-SN21R]MDT0509504.1 hypothetical protein [Novosphingobium sp. MMS21-SN21R]